VFTLEKKRVCEGLRENMSHGKRKKGKKTIDFIWWGKKERGKYMHPKWV